MNISDDNYYAHIVELTKMTRDDIVKPQERVVMNHILQHSGYETTIDGTIERLKKGIEIIERYKENKLQNKRTTNVGFNLS